MSESSRLLLARKELPKGSLVPESIRGKTYTYLQGREGKKVKSRYRKEEEIPTKGKRLERRKNVMNDVGYTNNSFRRYAWLVVSWSFQSQVKKEIDAGFPTMWNTARGQYSGHSMVVNGYQCYKREKGFWIFRLTEYRYLMFLNDNWQEKDIYFDLDAYGKNVSEEMFGTFLRVRDYVSF